MVKENKKTPKEEVKDIETPKEEVKDIETPKEEVKDIETPKEEVKDIETPKEESYKITKDYLISSNYQNITLKKDKIYTKSELIKIFKDEKQFNYRMLCTNLKHFLEKQTESKKKKKTIKELLFLTSDNLIVNDKETIEKGKKISFKELVKLFTKKGAEQLLKDKKLMEIKS